MMCYRDMTFCDHYSCSKFDTCHRALTKEEMTKAEQWMNPPLICRFAEKPECWEEVKSHE